MPGPGYGLDGREVLAECNGMDLLHTIPGPGNVIFVYFLK